MIGVIKSVVPSGGLVTFFIQKDDGKMDVVHADNGPAVRALDAAFGGVIKPGHRFDSTNVIGQRITYEVDDLGLMTGFEPA